MGISVFLTSVRQVHTKCTHTGVHTMSGILQDYSQVHDQPITTKFVCVWLFVNVWVEGGVHMGCTCFCVYLRVCVCVCIGLCVFVRLHIDGFVCMHGRANANKDTVG